MTTENSYIPRLVQVEQNKPELADTVTLYFDMPEGFSAQPGQFNMLYAPGVGEVPISISGDCAETRKLVHTVRDVGAVSKALCTAPAGTELGIRGPYGSWWPIEAAEGKDLVIMAGGIGLAPLRGVIYHALNHLDRFSSVWVLYGAREPGMILYPGELKSWQKQVNVLVTVDTASPGWAGQVGVVTRLVDQLDINIENSIAMLCGPEIMMRFCLQKLMQLGLDPANLYLSMERNMKCAIGFCGHCQYGPYFICKEGPVFSYSQVENIFQVREI